MRWQQSGLVRTVVITAVLGCFVSASLLYAAFGSWTTLPVPAGTMINQEQALPWVAHFIVGPGGGTLVGAWTAYDGMGDIGPSVLNGIVQKPQPAPGIYNCPMELVWNQSNGTLDRALGPGAYTMYWNTFCTYATRIVVTQTIRVIPG